MLGLALPRPCARRRARWPCPAWGPAWRTSRRDVRFWPCLAALARTTRHFKRVHSPHCCLLLCFCVYATMRMACGVAHCARNPSSTRRKIQKVVSEVFKDSRKYIGPRPRAKAEGGWSKRGGDQVHQRNTKQKKTKMKLMSKMLVS